MTTRGEINSNFYQIVEVDANGAPTLVKPEYIGTVSALDANISNVHISGGTNGYVLQTDGTGNLSWTAQTGGGGGNGVPGGSNTQVQYNDEGTFAGDASFTFDATTETVTANNANLTQLYVEGNIQSNTAVYVGYTANLTGLTNPTIIAKASGATYVQAAVVNGTPEGSADYVTYGDNGSDSGAWADMGFTGSNFSDPLYTLTGINDGYFIVQGDDSSAHGGNLVIATGQQGSTKDIVFGTGGFLTENEKMRFVHALGQFQIQPNTISTDSTSGALVVTGGAGIGGDLNVAGNVAGAFILGDGGYLSNVNFTGNVGNANYANFAGTAFNVAGGNVTGNVGNAVHAYFADVANSVSGGNVTGNVGNAVHAYFADVANSVSGSNVTGNVSQAVHAYFADVANSVAGANVSGIVANANFAANAAHATVANTANSVSLANVVGIGNIASINLNGSSSQVLYGNGVFANVGANISANFAAYAGNVTVNAQPNITSVGNLSNLQFNTSVTPITANPGQMFWDTGEQTITLGMNNGVQQQVGLESYILVKATSAITNGQAVMFTGANGSQMTAAPANAASAGFKAGYILGVATQDIALNAIGYITNFGQVHNLNTIAWNLGDMLWYDPSSTTGALTNTQPTDPAFQIQVGYVTRKNASDGHIQVRVDALTSLTNLTDVQITSPVLGESLIYAGANVWVNGNVEHANIANTVSVNAQPNITSVGTLTSLTVAGNLSVTANGIANLGNVANVRIAGGNAGDFMISLGSGNMTWFPSANANITIGTLTIGNTLTISTTSKLKLGGGTSGQFLQTDGASNLVWANGITTNPAGSNTEIQFNSNGAFGASNNLSFTNTAGSANLQLGAIDANSALVSFTSNNSSGGTKTASIKKFGGVTGINGLIITDDTRFTVNAPSFDVSSIASVSLGDVANVHITGGTANYFLQTDGSGNLTWAAGGGGGGGTPGGVNTSVQFNDGAGGFGGDTYFEYVGVDIGNATPPALSIGYYSPVIGSPAYSGGQLLLNAQSGYTTSFTKTKGNGLVITDTVVAGNSKITLTANIVSLGSNANINITGGTTGQVLTTDGAGNLSWTTASGSSTTDFTPSFLLGGM